jgi:radical SAM superfamily enzyme YgiQ (UPF0313 family)
MNLTLVGMFPATTIARFMLAPHLLKGYLDKYRPGTHQIQVLDFSARTSAKRIADKILASKSQIVGYSTYVWNSVRVREVAQALRAANPESAPIQIIGGPEVDLEWIKQHDSAHLFDFYVLGEGEKKLLQLMDMLTSPVDGTTGTLPPGVAAWRGDELFYLPSTDLIDDLDEIPSVYLDGVLDARLYEQQQAFLETQRGCRFRCQYCVYPKNRSDVARYSLARVFDELRFLIVDKRVEALRFFDALFTWDMERAKKIVSFLLELQVKEQVTLPWIYWEMMSYNMDEEFVALVAALKQRPKILNHRAVLSMDRPQFYSDLLAGYTAINCVGFQSFNRNALRVMKRPSVSLEKLDEFMRMVHTHNIVLKCDLILGLPEETMECYFSGLEAFLPYLHDSDHVLNIHRLQVLPGSPFELNTQTVEYSPHPPYMVVSTDWFSSQELAHTSRLTAILFRVLNSPFRHAFFTHWNRSGLRLQPLLEQLLEQFVQSPIAQESTLATAQAVDDDYWNGLAFSEISTEWLAEVLGATVLVVPSSDA